MEAKVASIVAVLLPVAGMLQDPSPSACLKKQIVLNPPINPVSKKLNLESNHRKR